VVQRTVTVLRRWAREGDDNEDVASQNVEENQPDCERNGRALDASEDTARPAICRTALTADNSDQQKSGALQTASVLLEDEYWQAQTAAKTAS